jgi:hypothetical protein
VEALNRHLEPLYVDEPGVRAWDGRGRRVALAIERETIARRWRNDHVREWIGVRVIDSDRQPATELAELLAEWLPMVGAHAPNRSDSLDDLLGAALKHAGTDP